MFRVSRCATLGFGFRFQGLRDCYEAFAQSFGFARLEVPHLGEKAAAILRGARDATWGRVAGKHGTNNQRGSNRTKENGRLKMAEGCSQFISF